MCISEYLKVTGHLQVLTFEDLPKSGKFNTCKYNIANKYYNIITLLKIAMPLCKSFHPQTFLAVHVVHELYIAC